MRDLHVEREIIVRRTRPALVIGLTALLAAVLAAPAGAKGGPPATSGPGPDWQINHEQVAGLAASIERGDATTVTGEIAGAAYVGQLPDDWNGRLLVWAHGYRGEFAERPLLTVDPPPLFADLVDDGTAWIASSYRRNSYDPGIGVIDTKNVTERAIELFGEPEHTYVAGVSMGGHVIGAAIETYPDLWDGALPMCGVMGDVELFDYFLDYNVAAAAFADLDAGSFEYPSDAWIAATVDPLIKPALSTFDEVAALFPLAGITDDVWALDGAFDPVNGDFLDGPGEGFKDFVEIGSGGERGQSGFLPDATAPSGFRPVNLYDVAWDYWHVAGAGDFFFSLGEGPGTIANRQGRVSQNTDMSYEDEYGQDFAFIDEGVTRIAAANRVRKAQGTKPAPIINGTPTIPVLTMHTIGDLFVPIEMQQIYAREVRANDLGTNLVQRAIRDVGHCSFTDAEFSTAYDDLFAWVEQDIAPAGDELVEGPGLADPSLGRLWTMNDGTAAARGGIRAFP